MSEGPPDGAGEQQEAVGVASTGVPEQGMTDAAEVSLSPCERALRALLEWTSDWYWEQDERFRFKRPADGLEFAAKLALTAPHSSEAHLGKAPWELPFAKIGDVDWAMHRARLVRHEPFRDFEHACAGPDGVLIWLSSDGYALFDAETGAFTGYRGTSRDITRRKLDERALRHGEARLQLALEVRGMGVCDWDAKDERVNCDARHLALFGFPESTSPIPLERLLSNVFPDDLGKVEGAIRRTVEQRDRAREEFRVCEADGSMRWLLGACDVFEADPDGTPTRVIGIAVDITDHKRVELELDASRRSLKEANARLAAANAELERRVAERGMALAAESARHASTQATLAQAQRIESIGQLAGGVAHDFNNLLAVIGGSLELIEPYLPERVSRELLADARSAVASGASLNRQLLAFARRRRLEPVRLPVNEHVASMARLLERTLGEHIALHLVLAPEVYDALVDPAEFDTALLNLAVNARDAMPDGGALIIETRNRVLDEDDEPVVAQGTADLFVEVTVTDTGVGMSPDVLEQALEPFFTTKEPGKGTGLGLSSVYGFVTQSHGSLKVHSRVGEGTVVRLWLPHVPPLAIPEEEGDAALAPAGSRGELVLVIEDDPAVRRLTLRRLRTLGYETLDAASGPEAIQRLETDAPVALVFSDVVMPGGMSGHDVVRWVLANRPGTGVLLTSGYNDPGRTNDVLEETGAFLLAKPYALEELERAVRVALESRSQER